MTPDRNDQGPLDDAENGVLGDSASIDTTAIGIIGAANAQVSVALRPEGDREGTPAVLTLTVTQLDGRRAAWFSLRREAAPDGEADGG